MSERDQRTEEASQHRREEARRDGNVARSRDLHAAVGLLAAAIALQWFGPLFFGSARQLVSDAITSLGSRTGALTPELAANSIASQALPLLLMAAPLGLALALGSAACGVAQGGFLIRWQSLGPDLSRLSVARGLSRTFRLRNGARGLFSLVRVLIVGWLGFRSMTHLLETSSSHPETGAQFVRSVWGRLWTEASALGVRIASALAVLALLDYALQRWLHARDLRMSRSEKLEEISEREGDPDVRRRLRALRKQILKTVSQRGAGA